MPTYVAFLRAINLGRNRTFRKDAIKAATEAAGGTDVETYINTGNVRLTHPARSVAKVRAALEEAYAAEAGFDVPTIVFTTRDLAALTARAEEVHAGHDGEIGNHYVTLYASAPSAAAVAEVQALEHAEETVVVEGRAAHVLLGGDIHTSKLLSSRQFNALGQGTARTIKVLRTVTEKWC
ncbi:uncharacterized protein (DUF1697 family) [Nocardioides cavernae]|uniref:Uncharacterized protein (DUF1697 family) n=1 Tax=Nocardioides cavernae TaxID=1921566 RepID=A0A7Y9H185_9ACTN|nr:DUF1697 domain-containing protein [Nocardioides cavernae]NYE35214.1 uncharacterized protein (DUF1697 family) [Nocardioides cavernae]